MFRSDIIVLNIYDDQTLFETVMRGHLFFVQISSHFEKFWKFGLFGFQITTKKIIKSKKKKN